MIQPAEEDTVKTQVLIVGSGPTGAVYARKLVDAGIRVLMVDVGAQETRNPGDHKKNVITFQKNTNAFINVIQGDLEKLSVPTKVGVFPTLNPTSFKSERAIWNGQNPRQEAATNLDAAAATRSVGGMGNHWTCCTPQPYPGIERPDCYLDEEWDRLFNEARELIHTPIDENGAGTQFENSIRQQLVKRTLQAAFPAGQNRDFKAMPLACQRDERNKDWVQWSSSATVFGDIAKKVDHDQRPLFELRPETQCTRVLRDPLTEEIYLAELVDLRTEYRYYVKADRYVIAAGAVLTPQILSNSGFETHLPALGKYMTEQTMTFCQIVLKDELLNEIKNDPYGLGWDKIVEKHMKYYPEDLLPIPFHDPDPQVTQPLSEARPWHTQIHRDAFSYGLVPDTYDQRAIVDLRFFGYVKPEKSNFVTFCGERNINGEEVKPGVTDLYGMPQPTFHYKLSKADSDRASDMMLDMIDVASKLGGFLPEAPPQFMPPGAALHICGTTRVGEDVEHSCVDKYSRVHTTPNLFLGGCNVIPTQIACNPTLTALCFAIVGAETILKDLNVRDYPYRLPA